MKERPNILLLYTDQERHNGWLPADAAVPVRRQVAGTSMSFDRCYTHTSPCSPARATLFTGEYVTEHGVSENVRSPELYLRPEDVTTLGHLLQANGYRTPYFGKWHLYPGPTPPMEDYGFTDWSGNDMAWWGLPGSGLEYDDVIAGQAARWLADHGSEAGPWFLTCALVNPHDIMWFPVDQPWYQERHPEHFAEIRSFNQGRGDWGRPDNLPVFDRDYPRYTEALPENFATDLTDRPEVHRRFLQAQAARAGWLDPGDVDAWLRQLDYYTVLHEMSDRSLGTVLDALAASGQAGDTVVVVTSDHGDQCGSHGLRSKGPWNYEETLRVPLSISVPGVTAGGTRTDALCSTVDLAVTILELGGVEPPEHLPGRSMLPLLTGEATEIREAVFFAQDWAWYPECMDSRYASRGFTDGRFKYARYYGVGGSGHTQGGRVGVKRVGPDAPFDDQEHELYDLQEDPHELVNLAADPGRRAQVRRMFDTLLELEAAELVRRVAAPPRPPASGARGA